MATDLFNNYYNNPQKQAIYTNMVCPGASSQDEITFNINGSDAEISNAKDTLSSIDLSKISSSLNEWENSSKIIPAHSILYVPGKSYGESYKRVVYGKFQDYVLSDDIDIQLNFSISYLKNDNFPCTDVISIDANSIQDLIDKLNEKFETLNANIDVEMMAYPDSDNYNLISFTSTKLGYDFYIDNVTYYCVTDDAFETYTEYPLEESIALYIPAKKYRNGAHKGVVIVPTYPKYNNDIASDKKSLAITHLNDRVNLFIKHRDDKYKKHTFDVFGDLSLMKEYDNCIIFADKFYYDDLDLSDNWLNDDKDEVIIVSNGMKIVSNKVMGLYGYCNYASANGLWNRFGEIYCNVATDDVANSDTYNYINSFVLYNPNDFDIQVNILTWN